MSVAAKDPGFQILRIPQQRPGTANKYLKMVISSSAAILFECPVHLCESFLEKSARSENATRVC